MQESAKTPLAGMSLEQLRSAAEALGLPRYAGSQLAQWLYEKRVTDISQMTNLSKAARQKLAESYTAGLPEPKAKAVSADGTVKFLFPAAGDGSGLDVEAVYIPDGDRATLCVSSQAGCKMGCKFCMTGRQGFHGNLTAHEIVGQVLAVDAMAARGELPNRLTNVVYMGMGEPMDNLEPVLASIDVLTAPWGLAWSPKRITVSTIGKLPQLRQLIESTQVHIAVSVHSPIRTERLAMMPAEQAYPIAEVAKMLRGYDFAHQRRLSAEYIMWRGVNDSKSHAEALARLLRGTSARVNLIRYHALPGDDQQPPSTQEMEAFRDCLNALGVTATIRASRGQDISAACGMLAGENKKANNNTQK